MEKALAKQLERIRKVVDKGAYEKALVLADEAIAQFPSACEPVSERLRALLHVRPWSDVLQQLKQSMARHQLGDLVIGDARALLVNLFTENAPFRGALLDYLLNIQAFEQIAFLLREVDDAERQRLIDGWSALANEIQDEVVANSWRVASGLGCFVIGDFDGAWKAWEAALQRDPRVLKKIMAICNREPNFDLTQLRNRLKVIRLISAAGKREESIHLLQVLGLESPENALQVLIEVPQIMEDRVQDRDVCQLRFSLASQLGDRELMSSAITDMVMLNEDDLFAFQKQALVNIDDREFKRFVLMQIAELYIKKGQWEPAAMLLESLFQEDEHGEVVALMEHVLENYPILPHLHMTVANYQVRHNLKPNALRHLSLIKEVGEFLRPLRQLLESTLAEQFDADYAEFLFDILPQESQRAALIRLTLCANLDAVDNSVYEKTLIKAPQTQRGPLWLLALTEVCRLSDRGHEAVTHLSELIERFPEMSPEALRLAERVCETVGSSQSLAKAIAEHLDELQPRDMWVLVKKQGERAFPAIETQPMAEKANRDTTVTDDVKSDKSPFGKGLSDIAGFVTEGEIQAAAQLAERLAEKHPDRFRMVLASLDRFREDEVHRLLWDKCRLNILIRVEAYDEASDFGHEILRGPVPQKQLAAIQQLVAFAHEGRGDHGEALKFFCLSSKNPRFYNANREHLVRLVFPKHRDMLQDVLQVVMQHKDAKVWRTLMEMWARHDSQCSDEMMRWYLRFAQHTKDAGAQIEAARYAFELGRVKDAQAALTQIDLTQESLEKPLVSLVEVAKERQPKDVQAGFLLGRFYLVAGDIGKSVAAFRELVARVPAAGSRVYEYLKKYLEVHREHGGNVQLYGLLIRVGLDLGYFVDCVNALRTLGESDRLSAVTLSDGIKRVMLKSPQAEAIVVLMDLFSDWDEHQRVIDLSMEADLARVDLDDRIVMLQKAAGDSQVSDRAQLALAKLFYSVQEFDRCRAALGLIHEDDVRGQAIQIYRKLVERLPEDLTLLREAAWACWLNGAFDEAIRFFSILVLEGDAHTAIEAYAALCDRGVPVSFEVLLGNTGLARNDALKAIRQVHQRLRDMDLLRWEKQGGPIPYDSMEWLLATGQVKRFRQLFDKMRSFVDRDQGERLQALFLCAQGRPYFGAMKLAQGSADMSLKRSLLAACDLYEAALLVRNGDSVTPYWLKREFLTQFGQPKQIALAINQVGAAREGIQASSEQSQEQKP